MSDTERAQPRPETRGRRPGFRMSEDQRIKIQNSKILSILIDHVEGVNEISQSRVTAAVALLKKVLPDLQAMTISGDPENPLEHRLSADAHFAEVVAAMELAGRAKAGITRGAGEVDTVSEAGATPASE